MTNDSAVDGFVIENTSKPLGVFSLLGLSRGDRLLV